MSPTASNERTQFILDIVHQQQPRNAIHIGSDDLVLTESLCKAINLVEDALLTVIPTYSASEKPSEKLFTLLAKVTPNLPVEAVKIPADKVLPDFYFQQQCIDFALLQPAPNFEQAMVAFYYLDKMLCPKGTVIIPQANTPVMKRLCRHMIWEHGYSLQAGDVKKTKTPLLAQAFRFGLSKAPESVKSKLHEWLHPDILDIENVLEIPDTLVALTKPVKSSNGGDIDYEAQMNMDFDALLDTLMKER